MLIAAFLLTAGTLAAQNCIVVDSEKIFKSLDAYNKAIESLDALAEEYQAAVDAKFEEVEQLYNSYQTQKASMSASTRQRWEEEILTREKAATEYQESLFGQEGTLMKRRVELIQPIQKKVFAAIEAYARSVGAEVVVDSSNNPTLLYSASTAERTQQVIDALKK